MIKDFVARTQHKKHDLRHLDQSSTNKFVFVLLIYCMLMSCNLFQVTLQIKGLNNTQDFEHVLSPGLQLTSISYSLILDSAGKHKFKGEVNPIIM
jgi:hypothetical protein